MSLEDDDYLFPLPGAEKEEEPGKEEEEPVKVKRINKRLRARGSQKGKKKGRDEEGGGETGDRRESNGGGSRNEGGGISEEKEDEVKKVEGVEEEEKKEDEDDVKKEEVVVGEEEKQEVDEVLFDIEAVGENNADLLGRGEGVARVGEERADRPLLGESFGPKVRHVPTVNGRQDSLLGHR